MKSKINFYYKVSKEAGFAEDEDGNPDECYLELGFNLKKSTTEEEAMTIKTGIKDEMLQSAANILMVDKSLLEEITEEEYLLNTEED